MGNLKLDKKYHVSVFFIFYFVYLLDIAVGAPYEEGTGVVYVYNGKTPRMEDKYSQRILGKDIRAGVSGFGYYISKFGEDLDENKYNGNLKKNDFICSKSIIFIPILL